MGRSRKIQLSTRSAHFLNSRGSQRPANHNPGLRSGGIRALPLWPCDNPQSRAIEISVVSQFEICLILNVADDW
jgi:hypothetical protein